MVNYLLLCSMLRTETFVSPFRRSLARAYILQDTLFTRSEYSRLQSWSYLDWYLFVTPCSSRSELPGSVESDSTSEALVTSPAVNLDRIYASYIAVITIFPTCPFHMVILSLPLSCQSSLTPSLAAKEGIKLFSWSYHLPENNKGPFVCL